MVGGGYTLTGTQVTRLSLLTGNGTLLMNGCLPGPGALERGLLLDGGVVWAEGYASGTGGLYMPGLFRQRLTRSTEVRYLGVILAKKHLCGESV